MEIKVPDMEWKRPGETSGLLPQTKTLHNPQSTVFSKSVNLLELPQKIHSPCAF